jgi:hypothetical protein
MRPAAWGLILSVLGGFFWIMFSVVFGIIYGITEATGGPTMPESYWALIYISGLAMIFGIPAGIIGEVVRWRRSKKTQKDLVAPSLQQTKSGSVKYCGQCRKESQANLAYCGYCGAKL